MIGDGPGPFNCECDGDSPCREYVIGEEPSDRLLPRTRVEKKARDKARWEVIRQRGGDVPDVLKNTTPRSDDSDRGGNGSGPSFSCVVTDARGHNRSRSRRDISYSSKILNALVCRGYAWLQSLEREKNSLLNHMY